MTATVEKAYAIGRQPQSAFSVDFESPTDLHLSFDLGDIDPSEISVEHTLHEVAIEVRPGCKGFVIENPLFMVESENDEQPDLDAFIERHADLRWATCTAQDLFEYFADFLISVRKIREEFIELPLSMIKALVIELCWRRDNYGYELTSESIREFLPLSQYKWLFESSASVSEGQNALARYLDKISSPMDSDSGRFSQKAHEMHGVATMAISEALTTGWNAGGRRDYRLANARVSHPVTGRVKSFRVDVYNGKVLMKLKFAA